MTHYPSEINSDEDPPIRLRENQDVIRIDGTLGQYSPDTQQITIFETGIAQVAELLSVRASDVKYVVRLHEWAHALLHLGLEKTERLRVLTDESAWPKAEAVANAWFKSLDQPLHERLAQLLTNYSLRCLLKDAKQPDAQSAIVRITEVFELLASRSPAEYRIDKYRDIPGSRVIASIGLLKAGTLVGDAAWDTVITW